MVRFFGRMLALAGTLAAMLVVVSPTWVFEAIGAELTVSDGWARGIGFVAMLVCFALFSGPSNFGSSEVAQQPKAPVGYLLERIPEDTATRFADLTTLSTAVGLVADGRKIAAIKAVRAANDIDLRDAKELVEELQRAIKA